MSPRHGTARSGSTATEDHDTFMRRLNADAHTAMTRLETACGWCGIACIDTRAEHERYARQSETTWRGAAA